MSITLRNLPRRASRRALSTPLKYGLNHRGALASSLVSLKSANRNLWELKSGANVSQALAKPAWTFRRNEFMIGSLNNWLGGGNNYPVLTSFLGVAVGLVPGFGTAAGITWTVFFTAMDSASASVSTQCFARPSDQLWLVEAVGLDDGDPTHMKQYWLVDPLRNGNAGPPESSWCIAEERNDLDI